MNWDVVYVVGTEKLEGRALQAVGRELKAVAKPGRRVVLNMANVQKADARGAQLILQIGAELTDSGGSLKLVGLRDKVMAFFELLRVHRTAEICGPEHGPIALSAAA